MYKIFIAGIDEAGRGPLFGPVTAACVVLPPGYRNKKIKDSKKLNEKTRELLFEEIQEVALAYSVIAVGPRRIDLLNILEATKQAMRLAASKVLRELEAGFGKSELHCLIDGNMKLGLSSKERAFSEEAIVKGDSKLLCISAASILAKVSRDRMMQSLDAKYPGYEIKTHKGYPTKLHKERVSLLGPSAAHRLSFAGVREHV